MNNGIDDFSVHTSGINGLELLFQLNLDLLSIADLKGNFIELNKEWENVLGYSIEELKTMNYLDLLHPDDLTSTLEILSILSTQEEIVNFKNRYKTKGGEYRTLEWRCKPNGEYVYSSACDITQKLRQAEIDETHDRFQQIVDNIGGVFWLLSADMKELLFISSNYQTLYGHKNPYDGDPLNLLKNVIYHEDKEFIDHGLDKFTQTGNFTDDFRVVRPDGEIRWVSSSAFPIYNDAGEIHRFAGVIHDITNRKETELSEQEKTCRLNAIVKALPDTLFIMSADGDYMDVQACDSDKLLAAKNELIGKNISDFFTPDQTAHFLSLFKTCLLENKVVQTTYQIEIEKEVMSFEARISPYDTDSVLSIVRDITKDLKMAEKLQFQTNMQRLLVKISNSYINIPADKLHSTLMDTLQELGEFVGADRFYLFDYRKEEHAFYNTHEWCAKGIEPQIEYLQGSPADDLEIWMETHVNGETMYIHDVMSLDVNDPTRQVLAPQGIKSIITVPLIDKGEYVGFVGIDSVHSKKMFDDDEQQLLKVFAQTLVSVRQRIQSESALREALNKAKESDRLKSAFLATISHELRTPLNHILGFGSLIKELTQEVNVREYANDIHKSGVELLSMIEDLFDLALAEKSSMVLRTSTVKGVELFVAAQTMLQTTLKNSGKEETINLVFTPEAPLMIKSFVTDRHKILQVLSNLFNNAVKFTESGSIEFSMCQIETGVEFCVKDTGIGIAKESQAYIFDLFRQLDDGYNRRYEGMGVGLAIARRIAEVLGATLRVESLPGKGACFYFSVLVF
jgi:PAS domain S-box-containing protein